jgi:hypothetical protein
MATFLGEDREEMIKDENNLLTIREGKRNIYSSEDLEMNVLILWGTPAGRRDAIDEKVLITQKSDRHPGDRIEQVLTLSRADGWHSHRIVRTGMPDFTKAINVK